ncbi:hypothetical protein CASFOL_003978 [Castilleja foliolosa]|uniref:X8 domain-containing protein n=1 Tax=Castilleja foliolosa TaxID=1961234 RepID=A0ABD3EJB7_9LAMI
MSVFVVFFMLILAMAGNSDANYCVCNSGLSDSVLQKNIDYACGAGADCAQIQQTGPCFNPNTVRDHCNYAVNSYYQRRGQTVGSCDFQGTATVTQTAPTTTTSTCVFPSGSRLWWNRNPNHRDPYYRQHTNHRNSNHRRNPNNRNSDLRRNSKHGRWHHHPGLVHDSPFQPWTHRKWIPERHGQQ